MADDREKLSIRPHPELPPPPSDEYVARVARALGAPIPVSGNQVKSDEPARAEVE